MSRAVVQSLPSGLGDAKRLAGRLGLDVHEIDVHTFPDGELRVTAGPAAPVTIVYAPLDKPNDKLVALLLAVEALRRNGARRLVLMAPYMCYMRQDVAFHPGEAISQKVVGHLLANAFDRIVTVDAHLHRTKDISAVFPGIESDDLSAIPAIADALSSLPLPANTIVAGPDEESSGWVSDLASRLGLEHTVGRKIRRGDRQVEIEIGNPDLIAGRNVVLLDDIVSSGGTLITCARALNSAGALSIDVIITHALFPPAMVDAFQAAGIRSIRSTNTVPHPTNAIPMDGVLATALLKEI
jgi:ribose-phosphate pyrophosphokinase